MWPFSRSPEPVRLDAAALSACAGRLEQDLGRNGRALWEASLKRGFRPAAAASWEQAAVSPSLADAAGHPPVRSRPSGLAERA